MATTSGSADDVRWLEVELGAVTGAALGLVEVGGSASVGGAGRSSHASSNQLQPSKKRTHARRAIATLDPHA